MKYEALIESLTEVSNNDKILKKGLTLTYELDDREHKKLDEHLYYLYNPNGTDFKYSDIIDVPVTDDENNLIFNAKIIKKNG